MTDHEHIWKKIISPLMEICIVDGCDEVRLPPEEITTEPTNLKPHQPN